MISLAELVEFNLDDASTVDTPFFDITDVQQCNAPFVKLDNYEANDNFLHSYQNEGIEDIRGADVFTSDSAVLSRNGDHGHGDHFPVHSQAETGITHGAHEGHNSHNDNQ